MVPAIRVYVADDHPLYREGLVDAVRSRQDFELAGAAEDGEQALKDIERLRPDVAILDERMPGRRGGQILEETKRRGLPTRILLISAYIDTDSIYGALQHGGGGYLSKLASRDAICEAIRAAALGEVSISPELQSALASEIRSRGESERPPLSDRELEVLSLLSTGLAAPEIANRMGLSHATVRSHLQRLYAKLGVSTQAGAVADGLRRRLIE
jgi:two-component system nitrate/nitrite response regulator NarL